MTAYVSGTGMPFAWQMLFGDRLVVDARIERARVALLDERQVAMVDAEDAGSLRSSCGQTNSRRLDRRSSRRLTRFDQIAEPPQLGEPIAGITAQAR